RQLSVPQYLFYPSIDPLSEKNKDLDESYVQKVCDDFGIDRSRPVLTQISRFDRLKDPVGVIQAYKLAKKYVDCQLVLPGGGASHPQADRGSGAFRGRLRLPDPLPAHASRLCRATWTARTRALEGKLLAHIQHEALAHSVPADVGIEQANQGDIRSITRAAGS